MTKRLLLWQAVMAGAQVLAGASGLTGLIGERWAGLLVLLVAACQAGTAAYGHGLMTPVPTLPPGIGVASSISPEGD